MDVNDPDVVDKMIFPHEEFRPLQQEQDQHCILDTSIPS